MMTKRQSHDHTHDHGHDHDHHHDHAHANGTHAHDRNHEGHAHDHNAHAHTHDTHEGHTHDHDQVNVRIHLHPESETDSLSIEEHEGALVASLVQKADGSLMAVEADCAARLESLAAAVILAGGTVGHIKASVTCGPSVSVLSTTGSKAAVTRSQPTQCAIEIAAIVFGLDEDTLREAVNHALL